MTITTVSIACDVGLPDNSEFTAARLDCTLSGPDYDTVSNDAIPAATTSVDLSSSGVGTINLWPVDRGTRNTHYAVTVFGTLMANGNAVTQSYSLGVIRPPSAGGADLANLLAQSSGGIVVGATIYETIADAVAAAIEASRDAAGYASAAEFAAIAAGAPIVTTLTSPTPANGTIELLKVDAGLIVYEVTGGAWAMVGWLQGPNFATVAALLASNATSLGDTGDIVNAGGYRYRIVTTGETHTTAGGVKLLVLPANGITQMLAFNPAADGTTNDKTLVDNSNQPGAVVDLGGKDYEYGGVFTAIARFINGRITDDNRTYDYRIATAETVPTVGQRRARLNYSTSVSLRVDGLPDEIAMGGFRIFGQYLKSRGRLVSTGLGAASHTTISIATQLSALTSPQSDNWYGVFACADLEDATVSYRLVPFLRAYSRSGNVVTLGAGGENHNITPATATYDVTANAFAGADCLVINNAGVFCGRITTITANTTTTVTMADGAGIGQLDFFLPAPVGFDAYCYLGAAYYESPGEWRNLADTGSTVHSRMVNLAEYAASGLVTNTKIRFGGCISPLAVGYIGSINAAINTTSTGILEERFAHDSSRHDIKRLMVDKDSTSNLNYGGDVALSFSKEQAAWHTAEASGGIGGARIGATMLTYGWLEL